MFGGIKIWIAGIIVSCILGIVTYAKISYDDMQLTIATQKADIVNKDLEIVTLYGNAEVEKVIHEKTVEAAVFAATSVEKKKAVVKEIIYDDNANKKGWTNELNSTKFYLW